MTTGVWVTLTVLVVMGFGLLVGPLDVTGRTNFATCAVAFALDDLVSHAIGRRRG